MTLRNSIAVLVMTLSGASALAHDGDHAGMSAITQQLHHLGSPLAITAVTLLVFIAGYRIRAAQAAADDGADRR